MSAALRERLTCTVPEMAAALGIGRDSAYAAVERGELPAIRVGRRLVVPVPKLLELLEGPRRHADLGNGVGPDDAHHGQH